jgi:hypothetical protein
MKEHTMEAIELAEKYFADVVEQESHGNVVPSRTEEIHWAIEGLEGISFIKYKQWLKANCMTGGSIHDRHVAGNPSYGK